ncbi:hypothetical protein PENTCL1PPCAC_16925, partial [Pristionchus entomophagus]
ELHNKLLGLRSSRDDSEVNRRGKSREEESGVTSLKSQRGKKGYLARRIFEIVCEVMASEGMEELFRRATAQGRDTTDSELADRMFNNIDTRFASATTRQEKVEVLSLVSDLGMTIDETIRCVPSATAHYINIAKKFNRGGMDFDIKYKRDRFDETKNARFVEFLYRSNALITLPWGDTLCTLSDGTKTPIASVARKFSFSRICRMYRKDLEMSKEMHLKLGRGSITRILKVLAKRKTERMTCVDEFSVDAYEGWKQLTAVVEELRGHGLIGNDEEKAMKRWIRISRAHLEGEYQSEVAESSKVAHHCSRFSLSDPTRKYYASQCAHEHHGKCTDCDQLYLLMANLSSLTDQLADAEAS